MSYDWKKIFKNKTDKELYDIVTGKQVLSNESVEYAKAELKKRGFNFNDIEIHKAGWNLSDLLIEEDNARKIINENEAKVLKYKELPVLITIILIIYLLVTKFTNFIIPISFLLIVIGLIIVTVLLINYQFNKQKQFQIKRIEQINKLKEKLEENVPNEKFNYIKRNIIRNVEENKKSKNILNYVLLAIILIFFLYKLIEIII